MRRAVLPVLTALALAAAPAAAFAQKGVSTAKLRKSKDLWATVNICDTAKQPDRLGIRASMPGDGRTLALYMRFQGQYLSALDNKWHNPPEGSDSGFRRIGKARKGVIEAGWSFKYVPPAEGVLTMRGAVTFEWRDKRRVVHRIREMTEAGHSRKEGSDPGGFSAAQCEIRR